MSSMAFEASGQSPRGTAASIPPRRKTARHALQRVITPAGLAAAAVCSALAGGAVAAAGRAPATALPAVTAAFDGHYGGPLVAAFEGRTGECARRATAADLVVRNGHALVSIGDYGPALHGPVRAGDAAQFRGAVDGPAVVTGRFEDHRFVGELRGWGCTYTFDLAGQP